jgi:phage FluMu protein gp41
MKMIQTEVEFELPHGYVDDEGTLHRRVVMRRARAVDEILPLRDPRVAKNEAYHGVVLLSRVITRIGTVDVINTQVIENLFVEDFNFCQTRYDEMNYGKREEAAP